MLDKLTGTYTSRPSSGPHKLHECLPLAIFLRNMPHQKRSTKHFNGTPCKGGRCYVITIEKTGENFCLIYDTKGQFTIHKITANEATYKLAKVKRVQFGAKGIPYLVTHDGHTIRYPDPIIKVNDTVRLDLETDKIIEHIKFEVAMITGGCNIWG
ncbi:40S ribosomal protein S4 [Gigaspora margarita]|uniref:40S ribosomal protein S4 n=1 Tax=Gigaspora margarita TaxID=4874 RepID=A0A8H4AAK5_GIGMA|nr:40S ribosomal protein S4 [Gigaspora margarita]